jgi:hypothetical protein
MPFSPWAISATWLHVEAPQKIQKKWTKTHFEQQFATSSYGVRIWRAWCSRKACEICSSLIQKKKSIFIFFLSTNCSNRKNFYGLSIIPLVCKMGYMTWRWAIYSIHFWQLQQFRPLKLSILWLPNLMACWIFGEHITLKTSIFSQEYRIC